MFFDRQVNRRLSTITQITKGKQKPFLHFEQASSTRQVLEAKKLRSWNSLSSLSKQETRVNLLEYQELISAPWGVFIVDQLGQTLIGHPSSIQLFMKVSQTTRSSEQHVLYRDWIDF